MNRSQKLSVWSISFLLLAAGSLTHPSGWTAAFIVLAAAFSLWSRIVRYPQQRLERGK